MKKTSLILAAVMLVGALLCLASCRGKIDAEGIWSEAIYTEDVTVGDGEKTVFVTVEVEDKSVTFTIRTDETILGDALLKHGLIEGEDGPYGLYIKKVNGITADYDVNQSYWGFYKDGEYMMTGVDGTEFADGDRYELVYSK